MVCEIGVSFLEPPPEGRGRYFARYNEIRSFPMVFQPLRVAETVQVSSMWICVDSDGRFEEDGVCLVLFNSVGCGELLSRFGAYGKTHDLRSINGPARQGGLCKDSGDDANNPLVAGRL